MQTSHCVSRRTFVLLLLFAILIFPVISCNNGGKTMIPRDNCITISRGKINAWLQTGWHKPGNANFIPTLVFDPLAGIPIEVDAFPTDKNGNVQTGKKVGMTIPGITPPCSFLPGLFVVRNNYDFAGNGFADASGKLINFTFLRLRPKAYPKDSTYMNFDVEIVTTSGRTETVTAMGETKPCPPYCPNQ